MGTKKKSRAQRRAYRQYCGLAHALDLVGERWTLLIVRNLLLGPLRYTELLRGLPGITTNLLAKRLREMEAAELVERVRPAPGESGHAYRLAPAGRALEPAVHALGRWGWRWMRGGPEAGEERSIEWLFVALMRRYRGGLELEAEVVADGVPYRFRLTSEVARIERGAVADAAVRVRGPSAALAALFLSGRPEARAWPAGVEVIGDEARAAELVDAFERGEPPV